MHVAVTGGTGLIGRRLVVRLREEGHTVRLLSRHRAGPVQGLSTGDSQAFWDAGTPPAPGLLEGCEAVVHLAGEPVAQRWTRGVKERIRASRVEGTAGLVRAAREAGGVRHFVSASAVGFYGEAGSRPLTEASPPGDDFLARVCVEWEAAAREAEGAGARVVLLRLGVVLHPEGGALQRVLPLFRAGLGGPVAGGGQWMSWVHREDAVALTLRALREEGERGAGAPLRGPVNVTAPHPVTNADFTRALGQALHRPAALPVPALAVRLALGEAAAAVLASQRALPAVAQEAGHRFLFPTLPEALADVLA
jgi:uncharacterized protein (TIGR01777 family)